MKVLVLAPLHDRQTWMYVTEALVELGHEVRAVDNRQNLGMALPTFRSFKPDFVLCSREKNLVSPVEDFRKDAPVVCWNVDARPNVSSFGGTLMKLFSLSHIFYTVAEGNIAQYQALCPNTQVKWLPEAAQPPYHDRQGLMDVDYDRYSCDVLFAGDVHGHWHKDRMRILQPLRKHYNVKIFGGDTFLLNEEHSKACQIAKVTLAMTHSPEINKYASARNYRILGAGGRMLAMNSKGFREMFPEEVCAVFNTWDPDFAIGMVDALLAVKTDDVRQRAYEWTQAGHLFKHRMQQIVEDVQAL